MKTACVISQLPDVGRAHLPQRGGVHEADVPAHQLVQRIGILPLTEPIQQFLIAQLRHHEHRVRPMRLPDTNFSSDRHGRTSACPVRPRRGCLV